MVRHAAGFTDGRRFAIAQTASVWEYGLGRGPSGRRYRFEVPGMRPAHSPAAPRGGSQDEGLRHEERRGFERQLI